MTNNKINLSQKESLYHAATKQLLYKFVSANNRQVAKKSMEQQICGRRADVYFELGRNKVAIEVQRSNISIQEIKERTRAFNDQGVHVLWILDGKGSCVASEKYPRDEKNVKVSLVELYLHKMYGGRTYYVNKNTRLKLIGKRTTLTAPFALHFSPSDEKKYRKRQFREGFVAYQVKNAHCFKIPDWNLLCTAFNGISIARFYDRNVASELKSTILTFARSSRLKGKSLFKAILKRFTSKYGKTFVITSILNLISDHKLDFGGNYEKKIKRKYYALF